LFAMTACGRLIQCGGTGADCGAIACFFLLAGCLQTWVLAQPVSQPRASNNDETTEQFRAIDITHNALSLDVDFQHQRIVAHCETTFQAHTAGRGHFDLKPPIQRYRIGRSGAWIEGSPSIVRLPRHPSKQTWLSPPHVFEPGRTYTMQLEYYLDAKSTARCRFESAFVPTGSTSKLISAVQFLKKAPPGASVPQDQLDFLMAVMDYDSRTYRTDGRTFLERYLPSSLEGDLHSASITVRLPAEQLEDHLLLGNGDVENVLTTDDTLVGYRIHYPAHSTCSSIYFHLLPRDRYYLTEQEISPRNQAPIPLRVYSTRAAGKRFHDQSASLARKYFQELVNEIGFYPHPEFLAHLYPRSGGMEYSGATSCNPASLRHELMHSWFGRGVLPEDGNAGWIDEAVTSWWIDGGARTYQQLPSLAAQQRKIRGPLVQIGRYLRMTNRGSYRQGAELIRILATLFEQNDQSLKLVLIGFLENHMHQTINTSDLLEHLQTALPGKAEVIEQLFARFVYHL